MTEVNWHNRNELSAEQCLELAGSYIDDPHGDTYVDPWEVLVRAQWLVARARWLVQSASHIRNRIVDSIPPYAGFHTPLHDSPPTSLIDQPDHRKRRRVKIRTGLPTSVDPPGHETQIIRLEERLCSLGAIVHTSHRWFHRDDGLFLCVGNHIGLNDIDTNKLTNQLCRLGRPGFSILHGQHAWKAMESDEWLWCRGYIKD